VACGSVSFSNWSPEIFVTNNNSDLCSSAM
jgi:hypothetical protein